MIVWNSTPLIIIYIKQIILQITNNIKYKPAVHTKFKGIMLTKTPEQPTIEQQQHNIVPIEKPTEENRVKSNGKILKDNTIRPSDRRPNNDKKSNNTTKQPVSKQITKTQDPTAEQRPTHNVNTRRQGRRLLWIYHDQYDSSILNKKSHKDIKGPAGENTQR
jgi:hypothetical protein